MLPEHDVSDNAESRPAPCADELVGGVPAVEAQAKCPVERGDGYGGKILAPHFHALAMPAVGTLYVG
jgi:hypothetical protein